MDRKKGIVQTILALLIGVGAIAGYLILQFVCFGADMLFAMVHEMGSYDDKQQYMENVQERYYDTVVVAYFICTVLAVSIVLLVLWLLKKYKKSNLLSEFGFPKLNLKNSGAIAACFVAGMTLNVSLSSFLSLLPIPEKWIEDNAASVSSLLQGNIVFVILSVAIMPPIIEEMLFRGIFHNLLKNALPLSGKMALIVSSIVVSIAFGIFHGNILQGLYTAFVSFILIFAYESTGYLTSSIALHIGFNGSSLLVYLLGSFYKEDAYVANTVIFGIATAAFLVAVYFLGRKKSQRISAS